jgi:hypothetical protein
LSTPRDIKIAISEALEEERAIILQDPQNRVWSKVLEILHGEAKQRFFTRVIAKYRRPYNKSLLGSRIENQCKRISHQI